MNSITVDFQHLILESKPIARSCLGIIHVKSEINKCQLKPYYSFGELEWISINLSKSAVFSLQTLENNLTSP